MDPSLITQLSVAQQNEISEYHIYSRLARVIPDKHNAAILRRIAEDERLSYVGSKGLFCITDL